MASMEIDNEDKYQVTQTIAYHIYLVQMLSMPKNSSETHSCLRFRGISPFGKTKDEILKSSNETRYKSSLNLAKEIYAVANAFDQSSRFQIGYWLGILNKESRYCFDVCGGKNCSNLSQLISGMKSFKLPYVDLGIGQINFDTAKGFLEKHFPDYMVGFQKLIDEGYFRHLSKDIKTAQHLRKFLIDKMPNSKLGLKVYKERTAAFFKLLMFDEKVNLSLSLPIYLQKIKEGINLDKIDDKSSRLYLYQRSARYKKYSNPIFEAVHKIPREHQFVWARSFGVLTYNGHHRHALDYAMDVYCIKSLVDSYLLRKKDLAHKYVYGDEHSPFYNFVDENQDQDLRNCDDITRLREQGTIVIESKTTPVLAYNNFFKTDQGQYSSKKEKITLIKVSSLVQLRAFKNFKEIVSLYGREGRLFIYSFVRRVLYPQEQYANLTTQDYESLIHQVIELNKNILGPGNTVEEYMQLKVPVI